MSDVVWRAVQAALGPGFDLVRELKGGMARVFVVDDTIRNRRIVVKVLSSELGRLVDRERFMREMKVAGMLHHPNIVSAVETGLADDLLFYVMPYIDGESLRELLRRERELSVERAVRIVHDIAKALEYAHARNIVHRDIKPENIVLERATGRAIVLDFGIARAIEKATDIVSVTSTGLTLGTPAYMSPEQGSAEQRIDGRSDLYSLGCVFYEMLAGLPPFVSSSARAVIARHVQEPAPAIEVVRPDVMPAISAVIQRLLAKAPAARYATATELVAAIDPDTIERGARQVATAPRRRRTTRAIAAVTALALVALSAGVLSRWTVRAGDDRVVAKPQNIAVLYLEAVPSDSALQIVARGLTRDLIYSLTRVPDLHLVSESGIRRFAPHAPIDSVSRTLSVGTVITGTLEAFGDSLSLDLQLVDAETLIGRRSARMRFSRDRLLTLRDSAVSLVRREFLPVIGRDAELLALRSETRSTVAWELRQRAHELATYVDEMPRRPADFGPQLRVIIRAESLLTVAANKDPSWQVPETERGWLVLRRAQMVSDARQGVLLDSAMLVAQQVLRRWPRTARGLELRGAIEYERLRNGVRTSSALLDSAASDLRDATIGDGQLVRAWTTLSAVLNRTGDSTGSLAAARRAIAVDGYERNVGRAMVVLVIRHLFDRHADSARTLCGSAIRRFPDDPGVQSCELSVLGWTGAGAADLAAFERSLASIERSGAFPLTAGMWPVGRYWRAAILARSGQTDSARAVLTRTKAALVQAGHEDDYLVNEAQVRTLLRDASEALTLLERTIMTDPAKRAGIAAAPWFDALHTEPRFQALVRVR